MQKFQLKNSLKILKNSHLFILQLCKVFVTMYGRSLVIALIVCLILLSFVGSVFFLVHNEGSNAFPIQNSSSWQFATCHKLSTTHETGDFFMVSSVSSYQESSILSEVSELIRPISTTMYLDQQFQVEGLVVHLTISPQNLQASTVTDTEFGIEFGPAIRVIRTVKMYQWIERKKTTSRRSTSSMVRLSVRL